MPYSETTRSEHMAWCKERALAYLPRDPAQALASFISDLDKHEATKGHAGLELTGMLMMAGHLSHPDKLREHIEGFH